MRLYPVLACDSERRRNSNSRKLSIWRTWASSRPSLPAAARISSHALETAVLNELQRRGAEVGYVTTGEAR